MYYFGNVLSIHCITKNFCLDYFQWNITKGRIPFFQDISFRWIVFCFKNFSELLWKKVCSCNAFGSSFFLKVDFSRNHLPIILTWTTFGIKVLPKFEFLLIGTKSYSEKSWQMMYKCTWNEVTLTTFFAIKIGH